VGTHVSRIALILAFAHTTHGVIAVGLLVLCEAIPGSVAAFLSGAVVDRFDKRRIMVFADLARMALLVAVALRPAPIAIYLMLAAQSIAAAFFNPARSASVPLVVGGSYLPKANALDQAASTAVMIAGPVLGAMIFLRFGIRIALLVDAGSYLVSALLIAPVSIRKVQAGADRSHDAESLLNQMKQGWHYLRGNRLASCLVALVGLSLLCVGLWTPVAPAFLHSFLHAGDASLGLQLAAFGTGGLVGSFLAPRAVRWLGKGRLFLIMLFAEAAAMWAYSITPLLAVSNAILLLWGAIVSVGVVPYYSLLQEKVDEKFLGRVFAVARQVESLATVGAIAVAIGLQHLLPPQRIFSAAAFVYFLLTAASLMTATGEHLWRSS
jgi:MFS family permease